MLARELDRRKFIRAAAGSVLAAGAAVACDSSDAPPPDGQIMAFSSDNFRGTGRGWGEQWINVRHEAPISHAEGIGVSPVEAAARKAVSDQFTQMEYMAQPVIFGGRWARDFQVECDVRADGPVEAGVIARWDYDVAYALLLVGRKKALLCRYDTTDRTILAQKKVALKDWAKVTFHVRDGELSGLVESSGRKYELQATDPDPLGPGLAGTLVNPISETGGGKGRFKRWRLHISTDEVPQDEIAYRFTGAIANDNGSYRARVATRSVLAAPVAFEYSADPSFKDSKTMGPFDPEGGLRAVRTWLSLLREGTEYHWRPIVGGVPGPPARFRTPPGSNGGSRFVFASCTSGRVAVYPSFAAAASFDPDFFIHAGDWGYADLNSVARRSDHFQARWTRLIRAPEVAELLTKTPLLFWQDDHDYQADNGWSGTIQPYTVTAFDELHANPADDYFDIRWGDLHVWCLDCRLFASDPDGPDGPAKTRIGLEQKQWLKSGMKKSDAPVKVVASGMVFRNKDPTDPGWHNDYAHERDELLKFFSELDATVVILSGDSHGQRLIHHFEFGDLFEITSSGTDFPPSAGQGNHDPEHTQINLGGRNGFALVELDPAGTDRKLTVRVIAPEDKSTLFEKSFPVG